MILSARLLLTVINFADGSLRFIDNAKKIRKEHPGRINTDFFDEWIPTIELAFSVTRLVQLVCLLLSFKWPVVARTFFSIELFSQMLMSLVPYMEYELLVNLHFIYLYFANLSLSIFQPKLDLTAMCLYIGFFLYSQSIVFNGVTKSQILALNLPMVFVGLLANVLFHYLVLQLIKLVSERDLFKSGHMKFVHDFKEGIVIMRN